MHGLGSHAGMAPALPPPAWRDLGASAARLRLAPTLLSGMSFRWKQRVDGIFEGVLGTDAYELKEIADAVHFRVLSKRPSPDAEARLRAHLSLGRGVDVCSWLDQQLLSDPPACFAKAAAALGGVRVLNVEKLESVVAFIGSANNNIKRNMQMVESLCAHFPESRIETEDSHCSKTALHFRFPTVEQLASLSEKTLWELGWGYRAPRLHRLARELSERGGVEFLEALSVLPEVEARAKLCELSGIGRKVADCILLFSYGRDSVVPVDTHCLQIAQKRLLPSIRGLSLSAGVYQKIVDRFHEIFGKEFAGWAFMVMFVGELSDFRKVIEARAQTKSNILIEAPAEIKSNLVETNIRSRFFLDPTKIESVSVAGSSAAVDSAAGSTAKPPDARAEREARREAVREKAVREKRVRETGVREKGVRELKREEIRAPEPAANATTAAKPADVATTAEPAAKPAATTEPVKIERTPIRAAPNTKRQTGAEKAGRGAVRRKLEPEDNGQPVRLGHTHTRLSGL